MDLVEPVEITQIENKWNQKNVEHKGHCVVELLTSKLQKGLPDLLCTYRNKVFTFSSSKNYNTFIENPLKYWNCKLQDKLPV
jgi:YHS domain-containing protein